MPINFSLAIKRLCIALGLNVDNYKAKPINSVGLKVIPVTMYQQPNLDQRAVDQR